MIWTDEANKAEVDYRTDKVRRGWNAGRKNRGAVRRRWQGPLRGSDLMR